MVNESDLILARLLQVPINCLQSNTKASPLSLIVRSKILMIIKLRTQGTVNKWSKCKKKKPKTEKSSSHNHLHLVSAAALVPPPPPPPPPASGGLYM